jgi:DNA-binding XRE family transcriptional regulator
MPRGQRTGYTSGYTSTPDKCNQELFSERLKGLRQQTQLSQKKLAEMIDVSVTTIQQL